MLKPHPKDSHQEARPTRAEGGCGLAEDPGEAGRGAPWGGGKGGLGPLPSLHFLTPPTGLAARSSKETEVRQREVGLGGEFFPDVSVCGLAALGLSSSPWTPALAERGGERVWSRVPGSRSLPPAALSPHRSTRAGKWRGLREDAGKGVGGHCGWDKRIGGWERG